MEMSVGADGWVRVGDLGDHSLFVHVTAPGVISELFLAADTPTGITAADLRALPLARIVHLATAEISTAKASSKPVPDVRADLSRAVPPRRLTRPAVRTLTAPTARRLDDTFLQQVADAYMDAVHAGAWPNKALADQAKVDVRTIERWVYMARKRDLLPITRPGAVG